MTNQEFLHEYNSINELLEKLEDIKRGYSLKSAWSAVVVAVCIAVVMLLVSCSAVFADEGVASFYGNGEKLNKHTANGEVFNPSDMTCATYSYPFNTLLKVTNLNNGKWVIVRVTDRGPNKRLGRIIDLTRDSFKKIASLKQGLIKVRVEKI